MMPHATIDGAPRDGTSILIWQQSAQAWIAARWYVPPAIPAVDREWSESTKCWIVARPEIVSPGYWMLVMAGEHPESRGLDEDECIWMPMPAGPDA